ncbi:PTS lactose/cellobiose transporter subunit IIA [Mycoplasmopsis gallinacea]|uniref:Lactose-specific phosphotransferase enzyme IIA component n=1 Tax=Mycoplasmopsis gallinacea TaxID=29556 RepID=A0A449A269_9BACT|nr:PTS lactose/cellobiose transporter subunit IIA [Mycoplasmopsis gallinacea]QIW62489.1 PTS lactose/cellobiose transporter subunit IIA [Mycoplasmopsis gallinacea]VEU58319.1 Lactose-specific phosphotransferase enzyme IIA component [Mycoplasmopsis gallinacea]
MENNIEQLCFELISFSGEAKNCFLEAIDLAFDEKLEQAKEKVKEGKKFLKNTHNAHSNLLTASLNGQIQNESVLIMHSEDQFMSAENALVMAEKMIKLVEKLTDKYKEGKNEKN